MITNSDKEDTDGSIPNNFQIELGSEATEYEEYYESTTSKEPHINYDYIYNTPIEDNTDKNIIQNMVSDVENLKSLTTTIKSKNLFTSTFEQGGINPDTGLDLSSGAYANYWRTGFFELTMETYTVSAANIYVDVGTVFVYCYDYDKLYLGRIQVSYGFFPRTFTINIKNTNYVRIMHTKDMYMQNYQIELGESSTNYAEPNDELYIPYSKIYNAPDFSQISSGEISSNIIYKNWLFLGDSITANSTENGWVYKFKQLVQANEDSTFQQAVGGSTICDYEEDCEYDGIPYRNMNYLGNQVVWCKRCGHNSRSFDCIIISSGTNDTNTFFPTDEEIESQFYSGNTQIPISECDRTTYAGALRWVIQSLKEDHPESVIILLTPLQRRIAMDNKDKIIKDMYPFIQKKRDIIIRMAKRMGVYCIDTSFVNITDMNMTDMNDGLHPNELGATRLAYYVYKQILNIL